MGYKSNAHGERFNNPESQTRDLDESGLTFELQTNDSFKLLKMF